MACEVCKWSIAMNKTLLSIHAESRGYVGNSNKGAVFLRRSVTTNSHTKLLTCTHLPIISNRFVTALSISYKADQCLYTKMYLRIV